MSVRRTWNEMEINTEIRKTSPTAVDQDPMKTAYHVKHNTNQVHHCPNILHSA